MVCVHVDGCVGCEWYVYMWMGVWDVSGGVHVNGECEWCVYMWMGVWDA